MNWLAHLLLSDPTPAFRLGGILPDLVSSSLLAGLPQEFQRGIRRHHQVDAYTDSHAIFRRSVQRFDPPLRRFGGILVDIFYDHFLTREWSAFSETPLSQFISDFYASCENLRAVLPPEAYAHLQQIQSGGWLSSYGDISGVSDVLRRISFRLRRPVDLTPSITILEQNYEAFHSDFVTFFPELCTHVKKSTLI